MRRAKPDDRTGDARHCAGVLMPKPCCQIFVASGIYATRPTTAYRDSSGPESRSDAHGATIVGDWEEPSGESRTNGP